ncbi:hypothetical protein VOLCADRAFT_101227 [Volvox carteri f. nagariensis]|uniref:Uncharacterized protein n=1 Tax=Volvox carteri f. nagariensis TaxID=3068 RepID=D8UM26_VOLCA|nr:uncharacterized protein VOLCADRAFT_101227 [Volvox carteri f. nagariensis]EFJ39223.1 hypothetical protein VOLCADRAFT_101227 [Volvox carteri f. nagariensis]|eukprot:XP_002959712.1 hypothetical protein VOLCADRAFT_101227 [Volvox carteri f. nagariensis]
MEPAILGRELLNEPRREASREGPGNIVLRVRVRNCTKMGVVYMGLKVVEVFGFSFGFSCTYVCNDPYKQKWVSSTADFVRELDRNHMITVGLEGFFEASNIATPAVLRSQPYHSLTSSGSVAISRGNTTAAAAAAAALGTVKNPSTVPAGEVVTIKATNAVLDRPVLSLLLLAVCSQDPATYQQNLNRRLATDADQIGHGPPHCKTTGQHVLNTMKSKDARGRREDTGSATRRELSVVRDRYFATGVTDAFPKQIPQQVT